MGKRFQYIVFSVALISSALFHILNNHYLANENPEALRSGITVHTNDDASYIAPVENFLQGKGWKSNAVGKAAYTTRTPGYGLLYLPARFFFSQNNALLALVIFQVLLFAFSITQVPAILTALLLNKKWKKILTLSFALLPMFYGFLSYTLTEAVTPSLLIIIVAMLVKGKPGLGKQFILWFLLSFLILVRPPLIVWMLAIPIFYLPLLKRNIIRLLGASIIVLTPTAIWQLHLYNVTGEFQGLHPIYQDDSNTVYRPPHKAIWNFHKSWGQTGPEFHNTIDFLASAARYNRDRDDAVIQTMNIVPARVKSLVSEDSLALNYGNYYDILQSQANEFRSEAPVAGLSEKEKELIAYFDRVEKRYSKSDFFYSQIIVPSQVFKTLALHSNLSLFVFQKPWRGNLIMEGLRLVCFANHTLAFYIFLLSIFVLFLNRNALIIIVPTACYLGYLCFIQRGIEERYTLPFLIPMIAVSAKTLELVYRRSIHLMKGK